MANTLNLGDGNWATKEDSLLGYNSENNNYKPLPFDFSRNSSATRINKEGLIETVGSGEPRIDFKDNTKGALLLEPERTNLVLTSASGTYGNSPASEANTTSPDGTNNAVIPTPDSVADRYGYSISSGAYATNTKLTYSWYKKRISTPIDTSFLGDLQFKVLVNVTQVGSTTQIQSDVNGFDRFQAVFNITDGSASSIIRGYFGNIVGIGNSSVAYFGHQVEQGSYATSYIPTSGSAVTRVDEDIALTLPDNASFNSSVGFTLYGEFLTNGGSGTSVSFIQANGNVGYLGFGSNGSVFRGRANDGTNNELFNSVSSIFTNSKLAVSVDSNGFSMYADGMSFATGNRDFSGINSLDSVIFREGTEEFGSLSISDFRIYNTRLSNSELSALTTI